MAAIMNDLCNVSELVGFESLVKGATYRILYARKCMSHQGIRLFLKLTHPHIFVKLPNYCVDILQMSQIDKINNINFFSTFLIGAGCLTAIPPPISTSAKGFDYVWIKTTAIL